MAKSIPINQVPPDIDPYVTKAVYNPLAEDFTCLIAKRPITVPAGEAVILPAPFANHVALHLADKIMRDRMNQFLFDKFQGLNEQGIEKWRIQTKVFISLEDVQKVKEQLMMDPEVAFGRESKVGTDIDVPSVKMEEGPKDVIAPKSGESVSGNSVIDEIKSRKESGNIKVSSAKIEPPSQPKINKEEDEDDDEIEAPRPRRKRA